MEEMKANQPGVGGKHGIQADLIGTAFILLTSFSVVANLSSFVFNQNPHIPVFQQNLQQTKNTP